MNNQIQDGAINYDDKDRVRKVLQWCDQWGNENGFGHDSFDMPMRQSRGDAEQAAGFKSGAGNYGRIKLFKLTWMFIKYKLMGHTPDLLHILNMVK